MGVFCVTIIMVWSFTGDSDMSNEQKELFDLQGLSGVQARVYSGNNLHSDKRRCSSQGCCTEKHWQKMVYINRRWWCCVSCMRKRKS